jgi:CRISP-associated protein Cas1
MKRIYADLTRLERDPPQDVVSFRALEAGRAAECFRAWREMPLQWKGLNERLIPKAGAGSGAELR